MHPNPLRPTRFALLALALLPVLAPAAADAQAYVPHRVYDARAGRFADFETLARRAADSDVVLFGEQHDDDGTHALQLALLEAVARRRGDVTLSLEMFERDVQPRLDAYLRGESDEAAFLAASRPWPNYAPHYRPLVEWAKARAWPVLAANTPRPLASMVSRGGLAAVDTLTGDRRGWVAAENRCPRDRYLERFREAMGSHPMGGSPEEAEAMILRFYEAQCIKDETMAESIARAWTPGRLIVHMNGAFHSDFRLGTAARVERRLPRARTLVISAVPVPDLDAVDPRTDRRRADYVIYVLRPAR